MKKHEEMDTVVLMKVCTKCNLEKEFAEFNESKNGKNGFASECRKCYLIRRKEYYQKNKEKEKERIKKYRIKDKHYYSEYNKKYYKKYYPNNKNKYQEYFQNNKKNRYAYLKKRKEENPVFRFNMNTRSLIINSFKRGNKNFIKKNKTEKILGCSISFFIEYIEQQFSKKMTLENYGEWHLDHIVPIASAQTKEDVIKLNHYTNFQPLWAEDNYRKRDKIIINK